MALSFPANPAAQTPVNTYSPTSSPAATDNGITYTWTGEVWEAATSGGGGGAVDSIIAGVGIAVDQPTGDVTITNTGGGGGTSNMPTGGSGEDAFYENTTTIDNSYSITPGKNAGTFGPVTVNGDITVPDGSTWTVVGGGEGGGSGGGGLRYQEGTWVPTLSDGVTNTYDGVAIQSWSRVGNTVTLFGRIGFTSGSAESIKVLGVPYEIMPNSLAVNDCYAGSAFCQKIPGTGFGISSFMGGTGENNDSCVLFYRNTTDNGFVTYTYSGFNANTEIIFSISYQTGDAEFNPTGNGALVTKDIQGTGGGGGGGGFWTRDGTTLKPANAGDSVTINSAGGSGSGRPAGISLNSNNYIYVSRDSGPVFEAYQVGTNEANVSINADGSITAAGTIGTLKPDGSTDFASFMQADGNAFFGGIYVGRVNNKNYLSRTPISGAGDPLYIGNSQINTTSTYSLWLDPDNPDNFNDANEYNGPVLDVKEMLLGFQAKIETLEAAKSALEARISTLEGGAN